MKQNDTAVSPVAGVILMVAITVILAGCIAAFVFGLSGNIEKAHEYSPIKNETITIVDKLWDGNANHFGYITTSAGTAYRVNEPIGYMQLQLNHTYNVEMTEWVWEEYFVITKINYEVLP